MDLHRMRLTMFAGFSFSFMLLAVAPVGAQDGGKHNDNNGPQSIDQSQTTPRDGFRASEFARLKGIARQKGTVPVIVELQVPNIGALTKASIRAKGRQVGAQADARLEAAIAPVAQAEIAKLAGTQHKLKRTYKTIPFVALSVSEQALARLEASPRVMSINEDTLARPSLENTVNITGASSAWASGFDGTGWYVAVLDTGIRSSHEFFAGKDIVESCFAAGGGVNPEQNGDCPNGEATMSGAGSAAHHATDPWSDHGTHVAGIATGNGPGSPAAGIARGADLIAIQIFSQFVDCDNDAPGEQPCVLTFGSDQTAGLENVFLLRNAFNIASVNMSIGGGFFDSEASCDAANISRKAAIDNLLGFGIATAIAAGNDGFCDGLGGPGCISSAIGVGATTDGDGEASFSNYHPDLLDIYAPGSSINASEGFADDDYGNKSGTSMATPHVAGTWAVLKQAYPTASVSTIFDLLHETGQPVNGRCETPAQRRIQIDAALDLLQPIAPCDNGKLTASDPVASDEYGYEIALGLDAAALAAHFDDDMGVDAGSVYVYRRTGTSWGGEVELHASDAAAGDQFGSDVSISGDVLVVGAEAGNAGTGAAYVFRWNGTSWIEEDILTASDAAASDRFGVAVGVSGDAIVIGASGDDDSFSSSGSVYVYRYNGSTWDKEQKINAFDAAQSDIFGRFVDIDGDVLVSSAPNDDDNFSGSGSAYVYRWNGTMWILDNKLTASDAATNDHFGQSLSLEGDRLAVGSYRSDTAGTDAGSVYIFEWSGVSWNEQEQITALDAADLSRFGQSVALSGDQLVVGAYFDNEAAVRAGAAYIFRKRPTEWLQDSKFTAGDASDDDRLGFSVAAAGGFAFLGVQKDDGGVGIDEGSVYVLAALDDCNGNHIADICDIQLDGSLDLDSDGLIDSCSCPLSSPPALQTQFSEALAVGDPELKNRVIAVTAGDTGELQTIRVTWDAQPNYAGGHGALVGQQKYLMQPFQVCESSGDGLAITPPNCNAAPGQPQKWYWVSRLQCDPATAWYGDLGDLVNYCTSSGESCLVDGDCAEGTCGVDGAIHIADVSIVPSKNATQRSIYSVQVITEGCATDEEANYSAALVVDQPLFGDLVGTTPGECPMSIPNGSTTLIPDVTTALDKFSNSFCAPKKTRALLSSYGTFTIGIPDVLTALNAFSGQEWSEAAGPVCPAN